MFYAISKKSNNILFCSEMPSMLGMRCESSKLNAQRAYDYLIYQVQDKGFDTFIDGVNHVPPAHWLKINLGKPFKIVTERWWNPKINQTSTLSFNDAASHLRELFLDSVKLHLRSDVPLGVALSGGLDSSAITCAIRYLEPKIELHTFSYVATKSSLSEESWVDIVNKYTNAISHKIMVNTGDLENDIKSLIQVQGEPFCTTSMYAQYRVFKEAKDAGIKVVLEGQGADELLAGYHGYHGQRMRSLFEQRKFLDMLRFAYRWKKWPGRERLSPWSALVGQLIPDNLYKSLQAFAGVRSLPSWMNEKLLQDLNINTKPIRLDREKSASGRRVTEVLFRAISEGGLPSLLRYGDRNAMNFSIENRVPFLTIPLAEFLLSLPEKYLISEDGQTKYLFRTAMRGIVPNEIIDRRDKVGFETPMGDWVANLASKVAWSDKFGERGYLWKERKLSAHFKSIINNGQAFSPQDWRLLNLKLWMQINLDDNS
ncbi:MAG: asparagine synthetase B [Rickettsiales bacterium]|nr:asparagine synthetase B [Rickettsiales bacterium]